jgi:hypothetical protein
VFVRFFFFSFFFLPSRTLCIRLCLQQDTATSRFGKVIEVLAVLTLFSKGFCVGKKKKKKKSD